ncbi:MAG: hypothetical protein KDE46_00140 [Caldilineaceae bacterium]|nr:hypothetical protein [Caldilineaceae bacterium]
MRVKKILRFDWDAIAGVIAAVTAIVMHFLHIIEQDVLLTITVVLIALLFIRDLRRERDTEEAQSRIFENHTALQSIQAALTPPDVVLIGPAQLRTVSRQFCANARGEMLWFHVCLSMFKPQALFDVLLRPAIENPQVTSILFVLDERQKSMWEADVWPKIRRCQNYQCVQPPRWTTIDESISFIVSDSGSDGAPECLLSFWGEPFMARSTARDVPRYIFHVLSHSELVARFVEMERNYRFQEGELSNSPEIAS